MSKVSLKILVGLLLVGLLFAGLAKSELKEEEKPLIIATTTVGRNLVHQIGQDRVEINTITPSGLCPAHYDVKPSDAQAVSEASLVIYHGVEPWLEKLIQASGNKDIIKIKTQGPWNVPPDAAQMVEEIAEALIEIDSAHADFYRANAQSLGEDIDQLTKEIQEEAENQGVSGTKVIVMRWQKAFVSWLGLEVVADYPPPEMVSVKQAANLVKVGKEEKVALVIDNLQSGTGFGAQIAYKVGAVHVILSNFPGAVPYTQSYQQMIRHNADQILEAIKIYREK